jgi:hypothetical protein
MNRRTRLPALTLIAASLLGGIATAGSANAAAPGNDPAALARVRDTAMQSDYAYGRLEDLTDLVGPRLSGSAGAAAAVTQVADELRKLGAKVTLQPVKVPHWVRGVETGEVVDYKGRPAGVTQKVVLTALGGSGATPAAGITAEVIVVRSFEDLKARAAEVKGRIVLFDVPFDQNMADRGLAGTAYGQAVAFHGGRDGRRGGPGARRRRRRLPHRAHRRHQPAREQTHSGGRDHDRGRDAGQPPGAARPGAHAPDRDPANPAGRRQLQRDRRLARHRQGGRDRAGVGPPGFLGPGHRRE